MIVAVAIAVLLQATPTPPLQSGAFPTKASIAGVVVHSLTGEPIPNVRVSLGRTDAHLDVGLFGKRMLAAIQRDGPLGGFSVPGEILRTIKDSPGLPPADQAIFASPELTDVAEIVFGPTGGAAVVSKSVPPVMTNSQGQFAFSNVEPGTYKLMFSAVGYARQDYGQRFLGGTGTPVALVAGQTKRDIVMRLSPVSAISGRIFDALGHPIAGVPVHLLHRSYDDSANKKTQRVASAQTNDRGEYRFYFLSPGRYYIGAGQSDQPRPPGPQPDTGGFGTTYLSPNRIPQNYALTYSPGVAEPNSATPIDLQPGADLSGFDLFLGAQQTYRVQGHAVDSRTGHPPQSALVMLRPRASGDFVGFTGSGGATNPQDGSFEVRDVVPGDYTLTVGSGGETGEGLNVTVTNSDLDGLTVEIGATGSISGRFQMEPARASSTTRFDALGVQLRNAADSTARVPDAAVKPDGTFLIEGVSSAEYRLSVVGIPPGFYVKEARLGQTDVLNAPLRYAGTDLGTLDIVISPNAGQIDGTAIDARGQPAPGVEVVLIPDSNHSRTELFRPVTADASGHFSITTVVPGNYKLAAWNAIEPFAFFDPELINQAEQNGRPIRVAESSKQSVTVTVW